MTKRKIRVKQLLQDNEELRLALAEANAREAALREGLEMSVAGVAHDLKTPLALVQGYAECAKEGMDDKDYLSLICEKTERMNEAVLSLIDAFRADLSAAVVRRTDCKAKVFLAEVFEKFRPLARDKGITYRMGRVPNVTIRIDPMQMERVLQNILTNAIKFTEEKGKITLKAHIKNAMLEVVVTDNGQGIKKENIPHIFDKFYKEDEARTNATGNGLGLSIAKEFLLQHGGTIFAKSKEKKGTRIHFTLPMVPNLAKPRFCTRFEKKPLPLKLVHMTLWILFFSSFYRVMKYAETRCTQTLVASFFAFPFFFFFFVVDMVHELVYNKICFLAK